MTPVYLGIDIETTGLDPERDVILEIAALALTADLTEITRFESLVQHDRPIPVMSDYVRAMHTDNGLLAELAQGKGQRLEWIEDVLVQACDAYPERPILLGSSVHFDRAFLSRYMPRLVERLSHRHCDASSFCMFAPQLRAHGSARKPAHRALADIRFSAQVCRDARAMLIRTPPRKQGR